VKETAKLGRLPVINFAADGVETPADAAFDDAIRSRRCLLLDQEYLNQNNQH
jgi:hypothetical protein